MFKRSPVFAEDIFDVEITPDLDWTVTLLTQIANGDIHRTVIGSGRPEHWWDLTEAQCHVTWAIQNYCAERDKKLRKERDFEKGTIRYTVKK